jgi:hypothetical protein
VGEIGRDLCRDSRGNLEPVLVIWTPTLTNDQKTAIRTLKFSRDEPLLLQLIKQAELKAFASGAPL